MQEDYSTGLAGTAASAGGVVEPIGVVPPLYSFVLFKLRAFELLRGFEERLIMRTFIDLRSHVQTTT